MAWQLLSRDLSFGCAQPSLLEASGPGAGVVG
jgi:hypothetical protein